MLTSIGLRHVVVGLFFCDAVFVTVSAGCSKLQSAPMDSGSGSGGGDGSAVDGGDGPNDAGTCSAVCCSDADCGSCQTCSAGNCTAVKDQDHPSCVGTCDVNGVCKSKKGQLCVTTEAGCVSGTACVDGYCCDAACTGPCLACDISGSLGVCTSVASGPPHGTRQCTSVGQTCSAGTCLVRDGEPCVAGPDCVSNVCVTFYPDLDNDSYGDPSKPQKLCGASPPSGYVTDHTDCCDDGGNLSIAALIHPGADPQPNSAGGVCGVTWDYDCDGTIEISPGDTIKCNPDTCSNAEVSQLPQSQIATYCGLTIGACTCSMVSPGNCAGGCSVGSGTFVCR
jgi:hypothetical protein